MFHKNVAGLETEEAWNVAVAAVQDARRFWLQLLKQYHITRKSRVVVLNSTKYEYNYYTLIFLDALKKRMGLDNIYVLSSLKEKDTLLEQSGAVITEWISVEQQTIDNLCRLYRLYKFTDQIIFNMFESVCDANAEWCTKTGDIDVKDVVAISILGLEAVPEVPS